MCGEIIKELAQRSIWTPFMMFYDLLGPIIEAITNIMAKEYHNIIFMKL